MRKLLLGIVVVLVVLILATVVWLAGTLFAK